VLCRNKDVFSVFLDARHGQDQEKPWLYTFRTVQVLFLDAYFFGNLSIGNRTAFFESLGPAEEFNILPPFNALGNNYITIYKYVTNKNNENKKSEDHVFKGDSIGNGLI
jgi:hypothetical protein